MILPDFGVCTIPPSVTEKSPHEHHNKRTVGPHWRAEKRASISYRKEGPCPSHFLPRRKSFSHELFLNSLCTERVNMLIYYSSSFNNHPRLYNVVFNLFRAYFFHLFSCTFSITFPDFPCPQKAKKIPAHAGKTCP